MLCQKNCQPGCRKAEKPPPLPQAMENGGEALQCSRNPVLHMRLQRKDWRALLQAKKNNSRILQPPQAVKATAARPGDHHAQRREVSVLQDYQRMEKASAVLSAARRYHSMMWRSIDTLVRVFLLSQFSKLRRSLLFNAIYGLPFSTSLQKAPLWTLTKDTCFVQSTDCHC